MDTEVLDFNRYFTNEELQAVLAEWAQAYPALVQLGELGKSHEGKPIPLLTLTNTEIGADTDKAAIWIDANIHATEIAGTTVALHIAHTLLCGHGTGASGAVVNVHIRSNQGGSIQRQVRL